MRVCNESSSVRCGTCGSERRGKQGVGDRKAQLAIERKQGCCRTGVPGWWGASPARLAACGGGALYRGCKARRWNAGWFGGLLGFALLAWAVAQGRLWLAMAG